MRSKLSLYVLAVIVAVFSLAIAGCGDDDGGGGGGGADVSGNLSISGVWTGQEARSFRAVLDGFTTGEPERDRQVQPGRRSDPDRAVDGGPGRQPARPRGGRAAGPRARLRRAERAEADRLRREHDQRQLLRGRGRSRHRRRQALRAAVQGGQQVDRLVQRPALRAGGRRAAGGLRRLPRGGQDAEGIRHEAPTRSARRTAGRSPTCSRTSTCARPVPRSTTSSPRTTSRGPTSP